MVTIFALAGWNNTYDRTKNRVHLGYWLVLGSEEKVTCVVAESF